MFSGATETHLSSKLIPFPQLHPCTLSFSFPPLPLLHQLKYSPLFVTTAIPKTSPAPLSFTFISSAWSTIHRVLKLVITKEFRVDKTNTTRACSKGLAMVHCTVLVYALSPFLSRQSLSLCFSELNYQIIGHLISFEGHELHHKRKKCTRKTSFRFSSPLYVFMWVRRAI